MLSEVKLWMEWWGWTNKGGPGSIKKDVNENIIAYHKDDIWQIDIEYAVERCKKDKLYYGTDTKLYL